jgi:membrane associated rhomboid family serine protease
VYGRYSNYKRNNLNALWAILGVNVAVFIIDLVVYYYVSPNISNYLALNRDWVWSRPWTLVTTMFMHGSIMHIFANMISLYFLGSGVLVLIGQNKFLLVYFLGGIAGSLLFILLSPGTAVGASGAVFALGGVLTVMRPKLKVIVFPIPAPLPLWAVIIFGFLIITFFPRVAWQAHLGGLLVGLAFGFYFRRKQPRIMFFQ